MLTSEQIEETKALFARTRTGLLLSIRHTMNPDDSRDQASLALINTELDKRKRDDGAA